MENEFDLKGKVAIITGGSGALGGSMAISLIKSGAKVAVLSSRKETNEKRVTELKELGGEAMGLVCSVLDKEQLIIAKEKVLKEWGKVDILINAAGGNMPGATIEPEQTVFDLSMDDFQKVTDLNLNGTVLPTMVFAEAMVNQKKGSIINISSMSATQAITRVVGYSVAKAAIDNFTKWMAVEMALKFGEGIRVNAIAPGFFIGEQNRKLLTNEDGSLTERGQAVVNQTPMKRFGEAVELNGTVQWLCSDASRFVTGIIVPVDGGFSAFSGV
ncbi:SDR family oxidoreductase [Flammeovirgaceae bacterium SG7u.111]|nr:SDR family oxidoreductase [Flammeovirgaceae bacterium SG7u.132]WPO35500.1 SDR family oxidoreductase [Flammeovirgaceae bacterium SG7u.111]